MKSIIKEVEIISSASVVCFDFWVYHQMTNYNKIRNFQIKS